MTVLSRVRRCCAFFQSVVATQALKVTLETEIEVSASDNDSFRRDDTRLGYGGRCSVVKYRELELY